MSDKAAKPTGLRSDDGAVAIVVVALVFVSMILLAFVVDRGMAKVTRIQLQRSVDAAALAGAQEYCRGQSGADTLAKQAAHDLGAANGSDLPIVRMDAGTGNLSYLTVRGSEVVPQPFGGFTGSTRIAVGAIATAVRDCLSYSGYAIFAGDQITLNGGGNSGLVVAGHGAIYAGGSGGNCNSHCALEFNGQASHFLIGGGAFAPSADDIKQDYNYYSVPPGVVRNQAFVDTTSGTDPAAYATSIGLTARINALPTSGTIVATAPVSGGACAVDLSSALYSNASVILCNGNATVTGSAQSALRMIKATNNIVLVSTQIGSDSQPLIVYSAGGGIYPNAPGNNSVLVYGTVYAPAGEVLTNGHGLSVKAGRIIAQDFVVNGNGGTVTVDQAGDLDTVSPVQLVQ